ncbi:hypothetical protein SAMN04487846_3703 [Microbacterium sp. cf046]|nr:hypothetical protein [Microbacterium sp. cf046]SFS17984.1 hypothetical protein SAMN04487846_3703 [Microbacterium sp. cf046]
MARSRNSHRSNGTEPFLRREVGGAPYWLMILAALFLIAIGVVAVLQLVF